METQTMYQTAEGLLKDLNQSMAKNLGLPGKVELPELDESELKILQITFEGMVLKAREQKAQSILKRAYNEKMLQATNPPSTIADFKRELMRRGHELAVKEEWATDFVIDEENKEIYNVMSHYFFGQEIEYNGRIVSPKKGLLIFGNVGCGKTVAMRLFEKNPLQGYLFVSCRSVEAAYDQAGAEAIGYFSDVAMVNNPTQNYGQTYKGFAFDDLGTESDARHFGKVMNIMETIVLNRYDNSALRGPFTHITTNLGVDEIEERYGKRAFDRFRQMFNVIDFPTSAVSRR